MAAHILTGTFGSPVCSISDAAGEGLINKYPVEYFVYNSIDGMLHNNVSESRRMDNALFRLIDDKLVIWFRLKSSGMNSVINIVQICS